MYILDLRSFPKYLLILALVFYARYQNTGQLSSNLKQVKKGDKVVVNAGTRASYTSGYHGMYFLVEKKGMQDVKTTLKKGANYANSMKL